MLKLVIFFFFFVVEDVEFKWCNCVLGCEGYVIFYSKVFDVFVFIDDVFDFVVEVDFE